MALLLWHIMKCNKKREQRLICTAPSVLAVLQVWYAFVPIKAYGV